MKALADKITDDNWTQHYKEGDKRCLVAHIRVQYAPDRQNTRDAIERVAKALGWTPYGCYPYAEQYLVNWNDTPWRTAREVAELCAKAGI